MSKKSAVNLGVSCCSSKNCSSEANDNSMNKPAFINNKAYWIIGGKMASVVKIPKVSTKLVFKDIVGSWKARWDIGRMKYMVEPGLYCVGSSNAGSPVLVTANYKMSFDMLRKELDGLDAWIMVLDTNGINVWCAVHVQ